MSITNYPDADFTPDIPNSGANTGKQSYNPTGSFRFWAQKVLPTVYDDSLSYYEILTKVVNYLNAVIQNVDSLNESVDNTNSAFDTLQGYVNATKDTIVSAYNELQSYVNTYFDSLDVQEEINAKLDEMARDGSLSGVVSPFIPSAVSDWLSQNITPTSPAIDASLSISGAGADAKVTGDSIRTNSVAINGIAANEQFDATPNTLKFRQGSLSIETGEPLEASARIRLYNPLDMSPYKEFTLSCDSGYKWAMYAYDENNNYVPNKSNTSWETNSKTFNVYGFSHINILLSKQDNTTIVKEEAIHLHLQVVSKLSAELTDILVAADETRTQVADLKVEINGIATNEQFDATPNTLKFRQGSLSIETGEPLEASARIRLYNPLDMSPYKEFTLSCDSGYQWAMYAYDENNNYVPNKSNTSWETNSKTFNVYGFSHINILLSKQDNTTIVKEEAIHLHLQVVSKLSDETNTTNDKINTLLSLNGEYKNNLVNTATWTIGSIKTEDGSNLISTTRIRSNYIDLSNIESIGFYVDEGYKYIIFWYDENNIMQSINGNSQFQTIPQFFDAWGEATKIRLIVADINNGDASISYKEHLHSFSILKPQSIIKSVSSCEKTSVKVMSFNVQNWQGLNSNQKLIKSIIDDYSPDIICTQENLRTSIESQPVTQTIMANYPHYYRPTEIYNCVAIYSKYPIYETSVKLYDTQGEENRGYIKAYIYINKNKIAVFNTHLEILPNEMSSRAVRTAQAQELLSAVNNEEYFILCGDFNSYDAYNQNGYDYINVIKPFLDMGYKSANCSNQHGFLKTWYDGKTIEDSETSRCLDQTFSSTNIDINYVFVNKEKDNASNDSPIDHLPIISFCQING